MSEIFFSEAAAAAVLKKSVVTIGNFDGMHIGHQAIFAKAVEEAKARDARAVALTFEPHPEAFFRPDSAPVRLAPPPHKFDIMGQYGVDAIVVLSFDKTLAGQSPEEFVEGILVESLKASHVVVGEDFRFGKKRAGDTESLKELGAPHSMTRTAAEWVRWNDEVVSSTRIRKAIAKGEMAKVRGMLGRPYRLFGNVGHGDARGRTLGYPTANMNVEDMAIPRNGIYATTLATKGGTHWRAATSIGVRPTFGGGERTVETFVLDERIDDELDLYGDDVELDIYKRLRDELKFDGPEELVAQMDRDIEDVRAFFDDEGFDGG